MNDNTDIEKNIRDYLKSFSYQELSDAFGISYLKLNDMPLGSIIESIVYLEGEINDLASIIFKAEKDDTKVLRIGSKIPGAVYEQYRIKCNVFKKIMANKNIKTLVDAYLPTNRRPR